MSVRVCLGASNGLWDVEMGDDNSNDQSEERRIVRRYSSRSSATLIRETDSMRIGRPAAVADISTDGLSLWV